MDRGPKLTLGAGAAILIAGTTAYFGAEPIVKLFIKQPEAPTYPNIPNPPEKKPARRPPITLTIAIDHTRSAISGQIPDVKQAVVDFIEKGEILKDGDTVNVCQVAEHAECQGFELPQGKGALVDNVKSVEVVGKGRNTYLVESMGDIMDETRGSANAIVALWTDGDDEHPDAPSPQMHSPVKIVVPKSAYVGNAENVKKALDSKGRAEVSVDVATNGDEFGKILNVFTSDLQAGAQKKADIESDRDYAKRMQDHEQLKRELETNYQKLLAEYEKRSGEILDDIKDVKRKVRITVGLLLFATLLGIGILYRHENRPKLTGKITITTPIPGGRVGYTKDIFIPPYDKPWTYRTKDGRTFEFKPTRQGVMCDGKLLKDGDKIDPEDPNIIYKKIK